MPMAGLTDLSTSKILQFEQMYFALQAAIEGLGVVLVESFCEWLLKEGQDTERSIAQLTETMHWSH